jgi:plastocyanin
MEAKMVRARLVAALALLTLGMTACGGEIVEWKNDGSVAHNIIFADDASIGDPVIEAGGGVWQVKFTVPGTYQYSCTIHTGMVGTIVVTSV